MTETTAVPTLVFVEHVLWEPDDAWTAALEHVAGRFARVSPLDVDAVVGAGAIGNEVVKNLCLLGVGGISMLVGGIFGGLTLGKKNDLNASHMVDDRKAIARDGKTFALVSDVTLFTGAALAVTGLVLVLVNRKPRSPRRSVLAPSLGRGHAGLTWSLRF